MTEPAIPAQRGFRPAVLDVHQCHQTANAAVLFDRVEAMNVATAKSAAMTKRFTLLANGERVAGLTGAWVGVV